MKNLDHIKSLSMLYRLAIKDQKAVMENKDVDCDSDIWIEQYREDDDTRCIACLAGSIMFNTLGIQGLSKKNKDEDIDSAGAFDQLETKRDEVMLDIVDLTRISAFDAVVDIAEELSLIPVQSSIRDIFSRHLGAKKYEWDNDDMSGLHELLTKLEGLCTELEEMGL